MLVSPLVRLTLQSKVVSVTSYAVSQTFVNSVWASADGGGLRRCCGLTINKVRHRREVSRGGKEDDEARAAVDERPEGGP